MKRPLFTGLCTALVTPFLEEKVNYPMLEVLVNRQIEAGVDAIVIAGTTGESPTLTVEEKLELFRRAVEASRGRCRIIAGAGGNCTASSVELCRAAAGTGVDGLLVVTPFYNKPTQQGLVKHYRLIADSVDLPILAYNVPPRTGVDIGVEACWELAKIPNLVGIKEASGDISKIGRILARCGGELPVYSGNDDQTVPVMSMGGMGVISVVSNVLPAAMKAMTSAALAGDYALAASWQRRLLPMADLMFCQANPIPVKAAMGMMGYDVGPCRLPLDELTRANQSRISECLSALALGREV